MERKNNYKGESFDTIRALVSFLNTNNIDKENIIYINKSDETKLILLVYKEE